MPEPHFVSRSTRYASPIVTSQQAYRTITTVVEKAPWAALSGFTRLPSLRLFASGISDADMRAALVLPDNCHSRYTVDATMGLN